MSLSSSSPLPPTPELDSNGIFSDEPLREAREQALRGDWQAARHVVEDAGRDWELRGWRIGRLGLAAAEDDGWLGAWLRAEPADPTAVLLQAGTMIRRAVQARGIASSARTTEEQFQGFHTNMQAAAPVLRRAMRLAGSDDPTPWAEMMRTMFADQQTREASFDEVYAEAQRRDPYHFEIHLMAVQLRLDKWFGSHEQSFATAREIAAAAPAGSGVTLLPLYTHLEYAKREFHWDVTGDVPKAACEAYLRRPEVQDEVDRAVAKWRAGTPQSVLVPGWLQWLALYYTLAGRREQAKAVFDEIGPRVCPRHDWAYFWDTAQTGYLTAWRWANGGRRPVPGTELASTRSG
ncbi:hypothetical protein [Actinoplanes sp. NPDC026670]|uniref:hypothetical protein n=1 Tax=Actinoplanes sp. NPDC026670 TaxID=3154700 RepID=UPI003405D111